MTKTEKVARYFERHAGRFVSAFAIERLAPLAGRQEVSRCRQRGMKIEHVKQARGKKKAHGYIYTAA